MTDTNRINYLRIVLVAVGLTFIFGIWLLTKVWPSGWAWHGEGRSEYLEMILGLYVTLGIFLLRTARDPLAHLSLIWFTVWSSIVHSAIMAVQSLAKGQHLGHLLGDVPALLIVAGIIAVLTPRHRAEPASAASTLQVFTHQ